MKGPKLYPQWYTHYYSADGKVSIDALETYLDQVLAFTYLAGTIDLNDNVASTFHKALALGLHDATIEAQALLDQWKKDRDTENPDNVTAIV